jgi:prepilin-type N-terminal cleavage/methylation domain-containing protein
LLFSKNNITTLFITNKMKKNKGKAFSLIELSIVILIIGILVAGVTKGSSLLAKARLRTAQSLTQSSPVAATSGLVLWLETSLDQSIGVLEADNGEAVKVWHDINPQTSGKFYAVNNASEILYKETDGINSIPSLYFPASTNNAKTFFTLSSSSDASSVKKVVLQSRNNAYSYFLVAQAEGTVNNHDAFYNGDFTSDGWGYRNGTSKKTLLFTGGIDENNSDAATPSVEGGNALAQTEIISGTHTGTAGGNNHRLYVNGTIDGTISTTTTVTLEDPTDGFYIGSKDSTGSATDNWQGYISEIIIFDKKIKNSDRKAIEEYLGAKYSVDVAQ